MRSRWLAFALAAGLAACAAPRSVRIVDTASESIRRPDPRLEEWRRETEALATRESYGALKKAFALYAQVEASAGAGAASDENHLRSALLLAARAAELGIREPAYAETAARLIRSNPAWSVYEPFLMLVSLLPVNTAGVFDDGPAPVDPGPAVQAFRKDEARLLADADRDAALAYLRGALHVAYPGADSKAVVWPGLLRSFPGSLALKYRLGSVVENGPALWEEVLAADSEFFEVLAARGERALAERRLLSAEKDFLAAFEGIPESPLLAIRLASLGFALEEFDRSLEYYEKALAVAPSYKEAALGKAVALSCLGRSEEAAAILDGLIARGPALKGECLYWLAWNLNEMGDFIRAAEAVEAAKPILERSQVYTLSGTINLARSLVEAAEADLLKAVDLNAEDREAHFLLGKVYSQRRIWLDSGLHFRMAAYGYEQEELDLQSMASQIEAAELLPERKARLLARKKLQVEKARLTRATACYNAAAGFHNAGEFAIARAMAERAAFHPYFQAKAREFAAFLAEKK